MNSRGQPRTTAEWMQILKEHGEMKAALDEGGWYQAGLSIATMLAPRVKASGIVGGVKELIDKLDAAEAAAVPICIGPPLISILAKEGEWRSDTNQAIIAADGLFHKDPYEQLAAAEQDAETLATQLNIAQTYHCTEEAEQALAAHEARVKGELPKMVPLADVEPLLAAIDDIAPYCKPKYGMPEGACGALEDAPVEFYRKHPKQ